MVRHSSRSLALPLHSVAERPVHPLMSFIHVLGGRPLGLVPSTLPSRICFCIDSWRFVCPKYFSFFVLMVFNKLGCTSRISQTSLLVFLSVQLIFPRRRNVHISKALILSSEVLLRVHVSDPYRSVECI